MEVVIDYLSRLFASEREFGMCGPRVAVLAILSVRARRFAYLFISLLCVWADTSFRVIYLVPREGFSRLGPLLGSRSRVLDLGNFSTGCVYLEMKGGWLSRNRIRVLLHQLEMGAVQPTCSFLPFCSYILLCLLPSPPKTGDRLPIDMGIRSRMEVWRRGVGTC